MGTSTKADVQYIYHPNYVDAVAVRFWDENNSDDDVLEAEHYYLQDANFNVTAVTDDTGAVVERYAYTPYGEVTVLDDDFSADADGISDIGNEYLYTGRRLDPETGLQLNRNRYYHAPLGRWVNRDPGGRLESLRIGVPGPMMTTAVQHMTVERDPVIAFIRSQDYPDGFNLYQYVRSQPLIFVDPSGLKSDTCVKRCCRPIDTTGMGFWEQIGASLQSHCFLAQFSGPGCDNYDRGCGLTGTQGEGDPPANEKEGVGAGLGAVRSCSDCYRTKGNTKTDDEIMDCIKNTPARCDYSIWGYNCHDWVWEASEKCGLNCRPYPGPVGSP